MKIFGNVPKRYRKRRGISNIICDYSIEVPLVCPANYADPLIFRGFDDVVFEAGTSFGQQPVRQHLSRPFDRQVRGKDPDVRRGPDRAVIFRQIRIEQVRPDGHVDPVPALRV